jgi:hypothetical protein
MWPQQLLPLVLLVAALAACQGSPAREPMVDSRPTGQPPARRALGAVASPGRVACAGACRADLYDGNTLQELPVAADGTLTVPVWLGGGDTLLFLSGPGQVPQVRATGSGRPLGLVRLVPSPDPGQGWLAAAVVRVSGGGKRGGAVHMETLPGAHLLIEGAEGPREAITDRGGAVVVPLPPGRYSVRVGGAAYEIEVPAGGTVALPLVISRRMVD